MVAIEGFRRNTRLPTVQKDATRTESEGPRCPPPSYPFTQQQFFSDTRHGQATLQEASPVNQSHEPRRNHQGHLLS